MTVSIIAHAEEQINGGRDIVVGLAGFGVPDSIDEDDVLVDGKGVTDIMIGGEASASYYGNPADVSVSGTSITITIPTKVTGANGQSVDTADRRRRLHHRLQGWS